MESPLAVQWHRGSPLIAEGTHDTTNHGAAGVAPRFGGYELIFAPWQISETHFCSAAYGKGHCCALFSMAVVMVVCFAAVCLRWCDVLF